jgi:nitrous oxidase accessory protein
MTWRGMVEMQRKSREAIAIITILLISQLLFTTTIQSEKITVKKSNPQEIIVDINGTGHYTTIQDALDNSEENQIIYVKKGTYPEILNIRQTVKIVGEENTVINPISEKNKYAIRLGAPNIYIKNLIVTNGAPGLYTTALRISSSNNTIKNSVFSDCPIGILVWTSNNKIENCTFKNSQDEGIALLGSKFSKCENNTIKNCVFSNNCDGIELQYSSYNKIIKCEFFENTHSGIDAIAESNNNNLITECKIYNNTVHGIYLSSSSNNTIEKSQIYENKDGNIYLYGASIDNNIKNDNIFTKSENINNFLLSIINSFSSIFLTLIFKKNY